MNRRIAFFDFDGTITTRDTLLEFIKYSKGGFRFILGFLLSGPWLIAYKLKIISNQAAKERVLSFFFRNCPLDDFQRQCDHFATDRLPGLLRPKAIQEIATLQQAGFEIVIVSASPENWIRDWATRSGASLIATRLATRPVTSLATRESAPPPLIHGSVPVNDPSPARSVSPVRSIQILTGKIAGANCHGKEKVARIDKEYNLSDYSEIYAYGDSPGDRPMLAMANISFYKPFR